MAAGSHLLTTTHHRCFAHQRHMTPTAINSSLSTIPNAVTGKMVPGPLLLLVVLFFAGCAGQVYPPGGPRDTTPPLIVRTYPDTNAVRATPDHIEIEFNEYVVRQSVEESIFISPYVGPLEFEWSGKEIQIAFRDTLRARTTYVVSVGSSAADARERNTMASAFTLAFSTGDSLDRGLIGGRLFDEKPVGVMVFAYLLDGRMPDTLNPARVLPDYVTQTGTGGTFVLSNLAIGEYRLVAVQDEYRNFLYDPGVDRYGVPDRDILLTPARPRVSDIYFRLSREDTSKPFLVSAKATDGYHVTFRFSKALDTLAAQAGTFEVIDTASGRIIPLAEKFIPRGSPSTGGLVLSSPLDSGATYLLRVRGVFDADGNLADTSNASVAFTGVAGPDTIRPTVAVAGIRDSVTGIPWWTPLDLTVSEPAEREPFVRGITLLDSTRGKVRLIHRWLSPVDLRLQAERELMNNAWYTLGIALDSLRDLRGNGSGDSLLLLRFRTLDIKSTGVVTGVVSEAVPRPDTSRIYLTARSINLQPPEMRTLVLKREGGFSIDRLVEGRYLLDAFRDADRSGHFSPGLPYPFVSSERFTVGADTIKIRARWSLEGAWLQFP